MRMLLFILSSTFTLVSFSQSKSGEYISIGLQNNLLLNEQDKHHIKNLQLQKLPVGEQLQSDSSNIIK